MIRVWCLAKPFISPTGRIECVSFAVESARFLMFPLLPADPTRVNLHSSLEVNYWCQALNCTETRLRNAVLVVGPLVADVRAYLLR